MKKKTIPKKQEKSHIVPKALRGVSLIALVITIIVIIILTLIAFGSSTRTITNATYSKYISDISEVASAFHTRAAVIKGEEAAKGNNVTIEQVYHYLASNAQEFKAKGDLPLYTVIKDEGQIGMALPQIKVENSKGMTVDAQYAVTSEGEVFIWPPFEYEDQLVLNSTNSAESKASTNITVNDLSFNLNLDENNMLSPGQTYDEISYTVNFCKDDESLVTGNMTSQKFVLGTAQNLKANTYQKTGYHFSSWNTQLDGNGTSYANGEKAKDIANEAHATVNLYTMWAPNKYILRFDANGGTGEMSDQEVYYDSTTTINSNQFTRTGYTYSGWSRQQFNTNIEFQDGGTVLNLTPEEEEVIVLYAVWSANSYQITINDGAGGTTTVDVTYDNGLPSIEPPTQTGYTFAGYYDSEEGGVQYYDADGQSVRSWDVASDTELHARWEANEYTVILDKQSGSGGSSAVTATYDSAMPSMTIPERTGYTFLGYYDEPSGGTQYYTSTGESVHDWDKPNGSTLYARWQANAYTIEYYQGNNSADAGATVIGTSTHTYDESKALSAYSTFSGSLPASVPNNTWSFVGWSTTSNGTIAIYEDEENVINLASALGDTVRLYAVFSRDITFNSGIRNSSSVTQEQRYNPYDAINGITPVMVQTLSGITNWTKLGYRNDTSASTLGSLPASIVVTTSDVEFTPQYDQTATTYYGVYSRAYTANFYSGANHATNTTKTSSTAYYNSNANDVPSTISLELDSQANSSDISGWTELGWRDDTTASDKEYTYGSTQTVAWGTNFYSVYGRTLTIGYNSNGGTGTTSSTTKTIYLNSNSTSTSDQTVTLASNNFSKEGYTFDTWGEGSATGTSRVVGSSYNPSISYNDGTFGKTMYAKWTANTYTISYTLNNGTHGTNHPTSATYDSSFTVNNPTRTGYTFNGWNITGMDSVTHTYGSATSNSTSLSNVTATTFNNLRSTSGTVTFTNNDDAPNNIPEETEPHSDDNEQYSGDITEDNQHSDIIELEDTHSSYDDEESENNTISDEEDNDTTINDLIDNNQDSSGEEIPDWLKIE